MLYLCCFYWLMNKAISVNGLAEQNPEGNPNRDTERIYRESRRRRVAAIGEGCQSLTTGKPQPPGYTQMNRNWLIQDVRARARTIPESLAEESCD